MLFLARVQTKYLLESSATWTKGAVYSMEDLKGKIQEEDLRNIQGWYRGKTLMFEYEDVPISKMEKDIKEMYSSYDELPQDKKRTNKILKEIKETGKTLPVFMGSDGFVQEGRHRMVAMWLLGQKTIPTLIVREV